MSNILFILLKNVMFVPKFTPHPIIHEYAQDKYWIHSAFLFVQNLIYKVFIEKEKPHCWVIFCFSST